MYIFVAVYNEIIFSALATVSREEGWVKPQMTSTEDSDGQFAIRDGRHPLHEKVVDLFVPNDTNMGGSFGNKVLILTGPNASGKSVYLKQVGIICYLAHLGNYISVKLY